MKKLKYLALPILVAVLLASCGSNEEQTSAATESSTPAETTEARTLFISMTEEKQDPKPAVTTQVKASEESYVTAAEATEVPGETMPESSKQAQETQKSAEKTSEKRTDTTAPPKTTEKITDDGVEVVAEEEAQEAREEQEEQEEQEQPQKSEETKRSEAPQKEELPPISFDSAPATSAPPASRPETPAVSWGGSVTTTSSATEKSDDKPIELPFVPAF